MMATALATFKGVHASCSAAKHNVRYCGKLLLVMPEHVDVCVCKQCVLLTVARLKEKHANGGIHQVLYCLPQLKLKACM